jgi:hypothetical protein
MAGDSTDNLVADLTAPGVLVFYYLADGTTARARYFHDGARPIIEDVEDTLKASQEAGKLIPVDSLDSEVGGTLRRYIVPAAVVAVGHEEQTDVLAPVS